VNVWSTSQQNGTSSTGINVSALLGVGSPDGLPALAYHIPRVAIDYVFRFHLTLGVGGGIFVGSSNTKTADGAITDGPGLGLYVVEPRFGYLLPLGAHAALWPRAGVSFYGFTQSGTARTGLRASTSVTGVAIDVEPTVVIRPSKYTGITMSFLADVGLLGTQTQTPASASAHSVTASNYGLTFGVYVAF
jgi:hypothetical protein